MYLNISASTWAILTKHSLCIDGYVFNTSYIFLGFIPMRQGYERWLKEIELWKWLELIVVVAWSSHSCAPLPYPAFIKKLKFFLAGFFLQIDRNEVDQNYESIRVKTEFAQSLVKFYSEEGPYPKLSLGLRQRKKWGRDDIKGFLSSLFVFNFLLRVIVHRVTLANYQIVY